ncbi:MAG: hypothetical protein IJK31_04430 [Ruminococcus sp.]|nr:hypothetical protein [Ruminococcus sp.]
MKHRFSALVTSLALIASTAAVMPAAMAANADEVSYKKVDLTTDEATKDFFPEIFNQRSLGSCASSSTTYYQFTYETRKAVYNDYLNAHKDDPDQAKVREDAKKLLNFTYSPAYTYPQINGGVANGSSEQDAYGLFKHYGAVKMEDLPYDGGKGISFKDGDVVGAYYLYESVYNDLTEAEKDLFEKYGNMYRRKGEYISQKEYDDLSVADKKYYVPVSNDAGRYWRIQRIYRAVPRDEKALFEALKWRCGSPEIIQAKTMTDRLPGVVPRKFTDEEIKENDIKALQDIKTALDNGNIVVTSASKFNFDSFKTKVKVNGKEEWVTYQNTNEMVDGDDSGHSFTIVGYDDSIGFDINDDGDIEPGERGAFKVVNSWGTGYANDGYIWVMYDAVYKKSFVNCPAPTGTFITHENDKEVEHNIERIPAFNARFVINVEKKDIKLVTEVELMTNNFYDISVDNSCGTHKLESPRAKGTTSTVVYSGPVFSDITELCSDERGNRGNGRSFRVNVNNANKGGNTKVVIKNIYVKDDKGNVVAVENITPDDQVAAKFQAGGDDTSIDRYIDVLLPRGDMNYDGKFDEEDYDTVEAYYADPENSDLSLFQIELLDANDDGINDETDLAIFRDIMVK